MLPGLYRFLSRRARVDEAVRDVSNWFFRLIGGRRAARHATLVVALNRDVEAQFAGTAAAVVVEPNCALEPSDLAGETADLRGDDPDTGWPSSSVGSWGGRVRTWPSRAWSRAGLAVGRDGRRSRTGQCRGPGPGPGCRRSDRLPGMCPAATSWPPSGRPTHCCSPVFTTRPRGPWARPRRLVARWCASTPAVRRCWPGGTPMWCPVSRPHIGRRVGATLVATRRSGPARGSLERGPASRPAGRLVRTRPPPRCCCPRHRRDRADGSRTNSEAINDRLRKTQSPGRASGCHRHRGRGARIAYFARLRRPSR